MSHYLRNIVLIYHSLKFLQFFQLIRERIWSEKAVEFKSCDIDLVTETDKQVEQLLISNLKSKFPDHRYAFHICTLYIACTCIPDFMRQREREKILQKFIWKTDKTPVSQNVFFLYMMITVFWDVVLYSLIDTRVAGQSATTLFRVYTECGVQIHDRQNRFL